MLEVNCSEAPSISLV